MRKEILDALKAKFIGVSESVLGRIADRLDKTMTKSEEVKDAVDRLSFQQVLESYGDSRATEAQQTAVQNYEKKYNLKDGKSVHEGGPNLSVLPEQKDGEGGGHKEGGSDTVPQWAKSLIDANKALQDRLDKMDGERKTASRKERLSSAVEKLPESIRKAYGRTSVEGLTDEQFESLLGDVSKEVDGILKEGRSRGAVIGRPSGAQVPPAGNELTKEQLAAISTREGSQGSDKQPF